ncbi:MAG: CDP-alcohol phosphatidyltransferase family protein [Deltaproteobacteria bacterium]
MPAQRLRERFDQARLVNLANGLTTARVLLVPVFAYLLIEGRFRYALLVFALCGLSDMLDGLLARWLRQRTLLGFLLDPIADKILMATSFVVLAIVQVVPAWLTILIVSRDLFILVGSVLILLLLGTGEIAVTGLGKVNTSLQILTVLYLLSVRSFPGALERIAPGLDPMLTRGILLVCAVSTALSGLQYMAIGIRKISRA